MNAPVLGSAPKLRGFLYQYDGRVCLLEEDQVKAKGYESHQSDEVFCPSPAHVGIHDDEAANKRSEEWASENCHRENGNRKTTSTVVEHL